jgi:hypothetical protein
LQNFIDLAVHLFLIKICYVRYLLVFHADGKSSLVSDKKELKFICVGNTARWDTWESPLHATQYDTEYRFSHWPSSLTRLFTQHRVYIIFPRIFLTIMHTKDRLCDLVVRVPGYRSRRPGFDSRSYQIFWDVVGLERGPLSLVRIIEELLEWKSSGPGQENRINGRRDPLRWPSDTLYPQKLALTSPTSGDGSVSIVRLRTKSRGVCFLFVLLIMHTKKCFK